MSEANGFVILKAPPELLGKLDNGTEAISYAVMRQLFGHAQLAALASYEGLQFVSEYEGFYHEELEVDGDSACLSIFGAEWMPLMHALVEKAQGIEAYGRIQHEYGPIEFYALNADCRYIELVDPEGGTNAGRRKEIASHWKSLIPTALQSRWLSD